MITSIAIEHFKSIDKVELTLNNASIIVGQNATGKSNFIDAFRFLKDAVAYDIDRAVSDRHGIDSLRQWSPSRPYHITISVAFKVQHGSGQFSLTLGSSKGKYRIIKEEGSVVRRYRANDQDTSGESKHEHFLYHRDQNGRVELNINRDGHPRIYSANIDNVDELFIQPSGVDSLSRGISSLGIIRRALGGFEAYSIFPNILRAPQTPSNETRLSSSGDNWTSIFRGLQRTKRGIDAREEIISSLKRVMPQLDNINIQSLGGLMVPIFRIREHDGRLHNYNVSQVSDGTLRVLGILTALYQPNRPDVLALEEPEQTVHPAVVSLLADAIRDVSEETQIILTTHSPELLDRFDPEQVIACTMENGVTHLGRVSKRQRQAVRDNLFSLGELMSVEGLEA